MTSEENKTVPRISLAVAVSAMAVTLIIGSMLPAHAKSRRTTASTTCRETYNSGGAIYVPSDGSWVSFIKSGNFTGALVCEFPSDSYLRHDKVESVYMLGSHSISDSSLGFPEARLCISSHKGQDSVVCGEWKPLSHEGLGTRVKLLDADILSGRGSWFPSISVRGMRGEARLYGFEMLD